MSDAELNANLYVTSILLRLVWLWELETKWGVRPRR